MSWVRSYSRSIWWPVAVARTAVGMQIHAWRGGVYVILCRRFSVHDSEATVVEFLDESTQNIHPMGAFDEFVDAYAERFGAFRAAEQIIFPIPGACLKNGYGFTARMAKQRGWSATMVRIPFWFLELIPILPVIVGDGESSIHQLSLQRFVANADTTIGPRRLGVPNAGRRLWNQARKPEKSKRVAGRSNIAEFAKF